VRWGKECCGGGETYNHMEETNGSLQSCVRHTCPLIRGITHRPFRQKTDLTVKTLASSAAEAMAALHDQGGGRSCTGPTAAKEACSSLGCQASKAAANPR
jgi:hypothetical protein